MTGRAQEKPGTTAQGQIVWLTNLPQHWQVVPSKWLFAESKQRAQPGDDQLSATQAYGVILQAEFERLEGRQVVHSFLHQDKRKHVEPDDFVISMRSFQGGLERAWVQGAIRSSYVVLRPSSEVHPPFFAHMFKSSAYIQALQATSNFIRDGQDLNFNNFRLVNLPRVPMEQQRAIADFLDRKTAAIDSLIAKKERLLALLAEKRAALIHQAVTKGLDPSVPMKDSGVPWIGKIPAHWSVSKVKRVAQVVDCKHRTPSYVERGYPVVSTTEVNPGILDLSIATRFINEQDFLDMTEGGRRPTLGDIIYSRNASLGAAALVVSPDPFAMGQDVVLIRTQGAGLFLSHVLNSPVGLAQVNLACVGSTFKRINVSQIRELDVPWPPQQERPVISKRIKRLDEDFNALSSALIRQVGHLREYRQALITAAVIGQLDLTAPSAEPPPPDQPSLFGAAR